MLEAALLIESLRTILEPLKDEFKLDEWLPASSTYPQDIQDRDEAHWMACGIGIDMRGLEETSLYAAIARSRELYLLNPHARNIIDRYVDFIVGPGIAFRATDVSDDVRISAEKWWEEWCEQPDILFLEKSREIARRAFRDGDTFIHWSENRNECTLRFLNPLRVKDDRTGSKQATFGIRTAADDVQKIVAYVVAMPTTPASIKIIKAGEVQHIKFGTDSDVKRGLPLLYTIFEHLRRYATWQRDRFIFNKVQCSIPIIRQLLKASPAAVKKFADDQKTSTATDPQTGDSVRREIFRGGSVLTTGPGVEYKFPDPKSGAADAEKDGRGFLLAICAAVGLPEYLVTANTMNTNYASSRVGEEAAIKVFKPLQEMFIAHFKSIWWRVMKWGVRNRSVDKGVLGATLTATAPRIEMRNPLDEATAYEKLGAMGAVSPQTIATRTGHDWETERRNLEELGQESIAGGERTPAPSSKASEGEQARGRAEDEAAEVARRTQEQE